MGLDMHISRRRRTSTQKNDGGLEVSYEYEELVYWRKFHALLKHLPFPYGDAQCGSDVVLSRDDVEIILNFCTHNKNYFDNFNGVEALCELLYNWEEVRDGGQIVFHADW